ncbi:phage holin family protein [Frigoribacterium sp. 2-23]|uniref:phage holin family protein n=1 Tax=Frigoribacterium sp. 2-23 TaxID=3415006 RepID=UPI003C700D5F
MSDLKAPEESTKRSLGSLLGSLPELISRLIRGEITLAKAELVTKLKEAGLGIGLLVGAALFGFFLLAVLITAAVLGLATVLAPWLAALIVAAALLILTCVLALMGVSSLKKGVPPVPQHTVDNLKADVTALKGQGVYDNPRS